MHNDDLAADLLDVVNEPEFRRFLERLVADTARDSGRPIPRDTARVLLTSLRHTAERTLPTLAVALGDEPRPATATPVAQTASRVFGLEAEGMSAEDRDFEIARQFVRFARAALTHASTTSAQSALARAGREFAPGLVTPRRSAGGSP
jgi:hypothetical protein